MSAQRNIVIIGNGHVGSHCAYSLALQSVADEIILLDIDADKNAANAFDIADGACFFPAGVRVRTGDYGDVADAGLLVLSVGVSRKPGQTRLDLLDDSVRMLRDVIAHLQKGKLPRDLVVISITNPADVIADYLRKGLDMPRNRVFSTGTSLDTARLRRTLGEFFSVDPRSVGAFCLGEHGDSSMIPFSSVTIGGRSWEDVLRAHPALYLRKLKALQPETYRTLDRAHLYDAVRSYLLERTHMVGMDIINGKGSTEFGIGAALADMAKAVLRDEHRILPASVLLEGEYKNSGVHAGVPCVIGRKGIEEIIPLPLTGLEQREFDASCATMREYIARAERV